MHCSGLYEGATIGHRLVTIINPPFSVFFWLYMFPPKNIENILKMDRGGGVYGCSLANPSFSQIFNFFELDKPLITSDILTRLTIGALHLKIHLHSLEVVSRYRDPQLQVGKNY